MGQPVAMFEILSADPDRACEFYTRLFDWKVGPKFEGYQLVETADGSIGGGIGASLQDGDAGVKIYIRVNDLAAYISKASELGGTELVPPTDLPEGYGQFAVIGDPDGNAIGLWT